MGKIWVPSLFCGRTTKYLHGLNWQKITRNFLKLVLIYFLLEPILIPTLVSLEANANAKNKPKIIRRILSAYTVHSQYADASLQNAAYLPSDGYIWPVRGGLTQYFHYGHPGLDIALPSGNPCLASKSGIVEYAGWSKGYGNNVVLIHPDGSKTRYAHFSAILVKTGQGVTQGQSVGKVGSTGWSTGPHVHFEIYEKGVAVNPLARLK
ncbi:hypothetical protein AUK11_03495 [bacterium CG2_30_37_16]|nr:MAG: hypothetical protein AUK11_03495 [bacterium CG2_30_37_16]PIP30669.1 MAG: hypothetical protein COX25_03515 [bacterium (Candidatus Howlettbacteria) CG23_combo_of_CG06-09_8_20_14_all_37_9]PIY00046.1 MAG: hypothetical protein COZ22_01275 [bacterium (Candidatus Howlettbacteria) CG_4_10_14_3_um_filter_37_10]PJB05312.1 MAG: hypothetical protein CO123_04400 [bacterium (Candidatus Howlettbacteria) CG_4_9_14_3_um_filter_37_10]